MDAQIIKLPKFGYTHSGKGFIKYSVEAIMPLTHKTIPKAHISLLLSHQLIKFHPTFKSHQVTISVLRVTQKHYLVPLFQIDFRHAPAKVASTENEAVK